MPKQRPVPEESLDAMVAVLELVRRGRARSRSELIERTGLSRAVVTQRVNELLARGFLVETTAPSTGGRPPKRLEFRADTGYLLVADIGATSIDVAVTDGSGRVLAHRAEDALVSDGPDRVLGRTGELFDQLVAESRPSGQLWGIGVGVPGPVVFETGRIDDTFPPGELWSRTASTSTREVHEADVQRFATGPSWDGYPVRRHLFERYGVPVWVDNDVNIMALGERSAGEGAVARASIFVKVGTGIGAGIISNDRVHRGANGNAGVIGHIRSRGGSEQACGCGRIGCLEAVAGGWAIARDATEAARSGRSPIMAATLTEHGALSTRDVSRAASMGDAVAQELLREAGHVLGLTLADLVDFYNPSLIVLGGGVVGAGDAYLAAVRQVIYARSTPLATRDLVVRISALGQLAGATGAAAMVLDQLFSSTCLGGWIDAGQPAALRLADAA